MPTHTPETKNGNSFTAQSINTGTFNAESFSLTISSFLLMENGSYLLLEDSGKIVLALGALPTWSGESKTP